MPAEIGFVKMIHHNVLPEIDRVFHEVISQNIGSPKNPQAAIKNNAEWLKDILVKYIDDELRHCLRYGEQIIDLSDCK